jgi:hypothetical protein
MLSWLRVLLVLSASEILLIPSNAISLLPIIDKDFFTYIQLKKYFIIFEHLWNRFYSIICYAIPTYNYFYIKFTYIEVSKSCMIHERFWNEFCTFISYTIIIYKNNYVNIVRILRWVRALLLLIASAMYFTPSTPMLSLPIIIYFQSNTYIELGEGSISFKYFSYQFCSFNSYTIPAYNNL